MLASFQAWKEGHTDITCRFVCMPVARMEAIDRAREALAGARECMIDARAVALRSRVEELALASFHKDDVLAGKTRSHLSVPAQTKVVALARHYCS